MLYPPTSQTQFEHPLRRRPAFCFMLISVF
jgi:hypothetical protein